MKTKVYSHSFAIYDAKTDKLTKYWCDFVESRGNLTLVKLRNNTTREVLTKRLIKNYDNIPA